MTDGAKLTDDAFLPVGTPYTYAYLLHFTGIQYIALASKNREGQFHQRMLMLNDCLNAVSSLDGDRDWYLSPNAFRRGTRRRNVDVVSVRASWIDLDYYRSAMAGMSAEEVWEKVLAILERRRIPIPQMVVSTGRGLQLIWTFPKGLPATCEPRWTAIQRTLVELFVDFGPDPAASSLCGVLRLPGTINTKSGKLTYFVHLDIDNRVDFEDLYQTVLPLARPKYVRGANDKAHRSAPPKLSATRVEANRRAAAAVVEDIESLLRGRGPEHGPKTSRDLSAFIYGYFLLRAVERSLFWDQFLKFAEGFTSLTVGQSRRLAKSILAFKRRYSTEGAAARLGVTDDEVEKYNLQRLLPAGAKNDREKRQRRLESNRRHKARERQAKGHRRQNESLEATKPWTSMGISKSTYYRHVRKKEPSGSNPRP